MANNIVLRDAYAVDPTGPAAAPVVLATVEAGGVHTLAVGNAGLVSPGGGITGPFQMNGAIGRNSASYAVGPNGQAVGVSANTAGNLIVSPYCNEGGQWQYAAAAGGITNTTDVAVKSSTASARNYVTGIQVRNANAVATEFVIKDGSTVIWRTQLPANMAFSVDLAFATPLRGTANTAVNVACITAGAQVYANLQGYSSQA